MNKASLTLSRAGVGLLAIAVLAFVFAFSLTVRADETTDQTVDTSVVSDTSADPVIEEPAPEDGSAVDTKTPPVEEQAETMPEPIDEPSTEGEVLGETTEPEAPPAEEATPAPEASTSEEALPQVAEDVGTPELSTDKDDYHPGQIATIIGRLFTPISDFIVKVFGSDENNQNYTEAEVTVTTDEEGYFSFQYQLDDLYRPFYEVVASTLSGEQIAANWFRDSSIGTYDQCSNDDGDGYASGDIGCRWTNGNIQANNSTYFEGDSTVQRLWIEGYVPGSSHTVTFKYGTTKGGNHAYDYLTTWSASENWVAVADRCQDITGCTTASETTGAMQDDPNVTNTIEPAGASRFFTIRGGTITGVSIPAIVSGSYAGDSETVVTVTYTVGPSSGAMCSTKKVQGQDVTSCGIALWFGAHVAKSSEWTAFNGTTGAGSISGSPYHVALDQEDSASVGQRDNQMASAAIIQSASITIIKDAVPDSAQDFSFTTTGTGLSNFSLDDDANGTLSNTQTFNGLAAGTYTVAEGAVSGWATTAINCVDPTTNSTVNLGTRTASINLAAGENITCTFTNTLQTGHLVVQKTTLPGGDTTQFSINTTGTGTITGGGAGTITDALDKVYQVTAGTYSVAETVPAGWTKTGDTCQNVVITAGATSTCQITNTKQGNIIVQKETLPDNDPQSFSFTASYDNDGFSLSDNQSNNSGPLASGSYSVAESMPSGWASAGVSCVSSIGDTENNIASLELDPGETITCTFTNKKLGSIVLVKNTVGGNATFSFTSNLLTPANLTTDNGTASQTFNNLNTDPTYTLAEIVPGAWELTSAVCDGGETIDNIDLGHGETVTCTFTNTKKPTLTLVKTVVNDNGGTKTTADFQGKIDNGNVPWQSAQFVTVGAHTASETTQTGYTAGAWGGDCAAGGSVTLAAGENKTCTITNDDNAPVLHLRKVVTNDNGGTATLASFTLTADGTGANDLSGTSPVDSGAGLKADTFALSETNLSGYTASLWSCEGGTQNGANITLGLGQEATCTITNNDDAPSLTLVKQVVNDNGGTAVSENWTLTAAGYDPQSPDAGTYNLSESAGPSGYTQTSLTCDNTPGQVTSVTLGLGEDVTCTFVNDDIAPKLHLRKVVTNNNGGGATIADFTLIANGAGANDLSGTSPVDSGATLQADTWALSENNIAGYTASDWVCVGGTQNGANITVGIGGEATCTITNDDQQAFITVVKVVTNDNGGQALPNAFNLTLEGNPVSSGVAVPVNPGTYTAAETQLTGYTFEGFSGNCDLNGDVTVALGESKTCTLTNNDIQPKLTLTKAVVNDNGGTLQESDFPLSIDSTGVTSGLQFGINAGAHSASEVGSPDYTASGWGGDCAADGSITLAPGDVKACTITNDDKAPSLTLVKVVVNNNGGQAVITDWTLTATGPTSISGAGGATSGATFDAGSYALSESTGPAGYTASAWNCVGGTQNGSSITVDLGQAATCTITNDDQPGHLIVHKVTVPATDTTTQFSITLSSAPSTGNATQSIVGGASVDYTVNAGTYSVSEAALTGWDVTGNTCANIAVANGETKECTITNTKRGSVTIVKDAVPNDTQDFQFSFTGQTNFFLDDDAGVQDPQGTDQPVSKTFTDLVLGSYTATETLPNSFWKLNGVACTGNATPATNVSGGVSITVGAGENITCTFTNEKLAPTRTQGFWQTHTAYTSSIFASAAMQKFIGVNSAPVLGSHKGTITNAAGNGQSQLFGAFYSNIAKLSTGGQRTAVDKARMQLLQQLMAAKLNCAAFGCPASVQTLIANADAAYAAGNTASILSFVGQLDAYNNSGDTVIITGTPGKATPKDSQARANLLFWNAP